MICPSCSFDNVPGMEQCENCWMDLTQLDRPYSQDRVERSLMEDRVGRLQPRSPINIPSGSSLALAIRTLVDSSVGVVLIVDKFGKLIGILSERDLITRVAGIHLDLEEVIVDQVMTPSPQTVGPMESLASALQKMDLGGYRHLPVVEAHVPTGVISVRDMLKHVTDLCK